MERVSIVDLNPVLMALLRRGDPRCEIQLHARVTKSVHEPGDSIPMGIAGTVTGNACLYDESGKYDAYLVRWDGVASEEFYRGEGRIRKI